MAAPLLSITLPAVSDNDYKLIATAQFTALASGTDELIAYMYYAPFSGSQQDGDAVIMRTGEFTYTLTGEFDQVAHASGGGSVGLHWDTQGFVSDYSVSFSEMHLQAVQVKR